MTAVRAFVELVERAAPWLTRYPEYADVLDELAELEDGEWLRFCDSLQPDVVDVETDLL